MDWSFVEEQVPEVLFSACEVDGKKWVTGARWPGVRARWLREPQSLCFFA